MLTKKEIDNLTNLDYDRFMDVVIENMVDVCMDKELIGDLLTSGNNFLTGDISRIVRDKKINTILK